MKNLTYKDIVYYIDILEKMSQYKYGHYYHTWESFYCTDVLYLKKIEAIIVWKIANEIGLELNFHKLPAVFLDDDYISDFIQDFELAVCDFVFPSTDFMRENGWEEIDLFNCDTSEYENLDWEDNDEKLDACARDIFGEAFDVLDKSSIREYLAYVLQQEFYPYWPCLLKNERVGKIINYSNQHSDIKNTELYYKILTCLDAVCSPFEFCYSFESNAVSNSCFYAFTTGGYFDYDGETIELIHGKLYRKLYIVFLNKLLEYAEELYGIN